MTRLSERLRRCTYTLGPTGKEDPKPVNPDGFEAADRIEWLERELGAAIAGEAQRGETTEIGSTGTASTRAEGIAQPRAL